MFRQILMSILLTCAASSPAGASTGGEYSLTSRVLDNSGAVAKAGGEYEASFAFSQEGAAGGVSGDLYAAMLGFYSGLGSGVRPSVLSLSANELGPELLGVRQGTLWDARLSVKFQGNMVPDPLASSVALLMTRDKDGNPVSSLETVNMAYNPASQTLEVWPASGSWRSNATYELVISTSATDDQGFFLASPVRMKFSTLLNPAEDNIVLGTDDKSRIRIPAGALPRAAYVLFNNNPVQQPQRVLPGAIAEASRKLQRNRGKFYFPHAYTEINAYDSRNRPLTEPFARPGVLSLAYSDADNDGLVDSAPVPIRAKTNSVYWLDEKNSLWVKLPGSKVDTLARRVEASTPHFTVFAVVGSADYSTQEAYAYPVPFRPRGPNAGTGPGQTGTEESGITFVNLPSEAKIKVFNVRGELVWNGEDDAGDGRYVWNVRNNDGATVASGVYFYLVQSAQDSKTGKLVIIR